MKKRSVSKRSGTAPDRKAAGGRRGGSLLDKAYNEIKHRIITCHYRPGEVLSEASVSTELKIGRTPIHQAIHRLMMDDLVSILPRKGIMVRPVSIDEAMEIVGVRTVTEGYCARLAAERADDAELQRLQEILDESEEATETRDVERLMLLDREFHDTLARAARNKVLADTLRNLHERSLRFWFISLRDPDHHRRVLTQHRSIVEALRSRKPEAAEHAMREHINAFQRNITQQV
ncbi:MAG: GntR family transcriptional regulator [Pseudorhodoplanes sp.]|jgi:DNA-binding GntR family transcriptional regulator|nr:GntR family transcriptional regulator [Pseudorhodoplanes sp.]